MEWNVVEEKATKAAKAIDEAVFATFSRKIAVVMGTRLVYGGKQFSLACPLPRALHSCLPSIGRHLGAILSCQVG